VIADADVERAARAFLERASGDGRIRDREAFEAIVQREVELTMRQRRQIAAVDPASSAGTTEAT
jgi:hypothetical protein